MPNGRALPEAILVAVARLTMDQRETDGVALRQALHNAGHGASGETMFLRLAELQDDGLVEFYKAGGPRDLESVKLLRLTPTGRAEAKELDRDHAGMTLSGRTIARLTEPFEGGSGPTHNSIERIWTAEDASDYLPEEGNKAERVMGGLRALRDGRRPAAGRVELPPNPEKLKRVASGLAEMLLASRLVKEEDVAEALGASGPPAPAAPPPHRAQPEPSARGVVHSAQPPPAPTGPIFVVHGHEHGLLHEVVRVLEQATSREVIVLHEQANAGRTILEKFEAHAATASYAVVLLTGDDVGGAVGGPTAPRGRQNVIFELGFFFGRLGRDRVAVLLASGVEQPSDIAGLVYIPVDPNGAWKYRLAREMGAARIHVAHDRIP